MGSLHTPLGRLRVIGLWEGISFLVLLVIAARFAAAPPAVTVAYTALAKAGALVAFDAIVVGDRAGSSVEFTADGAALMPAGGKVFVSGQAHAGPGLATSAKTVMHNLFRALEHVGLTKADVVQV